MSEEIKQGTVKFFNNDKGFGFIKDENDEDIFIHISNTIDDITEGDVVSYEPIDTDKGKAAKDVRILEV